MTQEDFLSLVDDRFYIQVVTKTIINSSLNHGYDDGVAGINYDEIDDYKENLELIIQDLTTQQVSVYTHVNHMSDKQLYDFILSEIELIFEEEAT